MPKKPSKNSYNESHNKFIVNGVLVPALEDEYQALRQERANATTDDQIEACDGKIEAFRKRARIDPRAKTGLSELNIETVDEFLRWLNVELLWLDSPNSKRFDCEGLVKEASTIAAQLYDGNQQLSEPPTIPPRASVKAALRTYKRWAESAGEKTEKRPTVDIPATHRADGVADGEPLRTRFLADVFRIDKSTAGRNDADRLTDPERRNAHVYTWKWVVSHCESNDKNAGDLLAKWQRSAGNRST